MSIQSSAESARAVGWIGRMWRVRLAADMSLVGVGTVRPSREAKLTWPCGGASSLVSLIGFRGRLPTARPHWSESATQIARIPSAGPSSGSSSAFIAEAVALRAGQLAVRCCWCWCGSSALSSDWSPALEPGRSRGRPAICCATTANSGCPALHWGLGNDEIGAGRVASGS